MPITLNRYRFQSPEDPDLRRAAGDWEKGVNRQQKRLVRNYDQWSVAVRKELDRAIKRGASEVELGAIVDRASASLEAGLVKICNEGTKQAAKISAGERVGIPSIVSRIDKQIQINNTLVSEALMPSVKDRLGKKIIPGMDKKALKGAFDSLRGMPASYAGGYWTMIFETQRDLGKNKERERRGEGLEPEPIYWVLDKAANNCEDCLAYAGEYPSWDDLPTVPAGAVRCKGNCRCHLETYVDGKWQRGVY